MTVSSQTRGITFTGTGSASPFPLPFRFFNNSEITAYLVEDNGALTLLSQGVDYTLTGAGEPEIDGGAIGTLTKTVPLAIGKKMYVARTIPAVQQADIVNQGEFFASLHEDVFDRLTMVDQQHAEELSRCVKTSPTDEITPDQLLANIKASENSAAASAASASASATSAAASYDSFDDRYLGAKTSNPTLDNDGSALLEGALYWNTVAKEMRVYNGTAWAGVGTPIPTTNLDTLTGTGLFACVDVPGVPSTSYLGWWVYQIDAGAGFWKNQTAWQQGNPSAQYVRSSGDGTTWNAWIPVVFNNSPAFTGTPTAPTAAAGTNTTQLANTAFVKAAVDASPMLGAGQTWQNVTGSRALGTTYTNSSGKPIQVSIRSDVDDGYTQLTVGGIVVAMSGNTAGVGDNRNTVSAIVPNGAAYVYNGSALSLWAELR